MVLWRNKIFQKSKGREVKLKKGEVNQVKQVKVKIIVVAEDTRGRKLRIQG